jgi:hypothetical protein
MKKIINYLFLAVVIVSFIGCVGMPEYSSSPEYSSIVRGNLTEIMLTGINHEQDIIGLWKGKNIQNSTHSKITFDEDGYVWEDIYSDLTGDKIATIEGQYSTQNDILEISNIEGDVYQFEYLLKSGQLKLKSLSK